MIDKESFLKFLNLIHLKGNAQNSEVLFQSYADKLVAHARTLDKSFGLQAIYNDVFPEKEEVAILYFEDFINFIKSLEDDFELSYKNNKILLESNSSQSKKSKKTKSNTKISLNMQHRDLISNKLETSKFAKILDNTKNNQVKFILTKEVISSILEKYKNLISSDSDKQNAIIYFRLENEKLFLKLNNKNKEIKMECEFELQGLFVPESFQFCIDIKIMDLFQYIDNDVSVSVNYPDNTVLTINYKSEKIEFNYLLSLQPTTKKEDSNE
jgi:hypothetical protein